MPNLESADSKLFDSIINRIHNFNWNGCDVYRLLTDLRKFVCIQQAALKEANDELAEVREMTMTLAEVREMLIEQWKRGRRAAGPREDMSHAESSTDVLLREHGYGGEP